MTQRGWWSLALGLLAGVAIILGFKMLSGPSVSDGSAAAPGDTDARTITRSSESDSAVSPFSTDVNSNGGADQSASSASSVNTVERPTSVDTASEPSVTREWPEVDIYSLGQRNITDADFATLVERLKADPEFLQAIINEFRLETDTDRLRRLAQLLGDVNLPEVTALASELIFSGDSASRKVGLELLKYVQPGNNDARELVAGLLTTEYQPEVLVDTLNTLAVPGEVDNESRAGMSEQVALLATHQDARVRRSSIDILSRWSEDPQHTPIILNGLQDEDRFVRQTSAYALVGHEDESYEVIQSLLAVAANPDEEKRVRRGSILALKGMAIDTETRNRVAAIELQLNTRTLDR